MFKLYSMKRSVCGTNERIIWGFGLLLKCKVFLVYLTAVLKIENSFCCAGLKPHTTNFPVKKWIYQKNPGSTNFEIIFLIKAGLLSILTI